MTLLLVGASLETLSLAKRLGQSVSAVSDPAWPDPVFYGLPCYGDDQQALAEGEYDGVILAIDAPKIRAKADRFFAERSLPVVDLIEGFVDDETRWGPGLLVQREASVSVNCRLGRAVRLNIGALVMHDVELADYVTVAPRAAIMGRVSVGPFSYVGAGATVLTGVTIGAECVIGAGAVVTRNVAAGSVVKGNPAK